MKKEGLPSISYTYSWNNLKLIKLHYSLGEETSHMMIATYLRPGKEQGLSEKTDREDREKSHQDLLAFFFSEQERWCTLSQTMEYCLVSLPNCLL